MKQLSNVLENIFITESFKSSILRDLMSSVKNVAPKTIDFLPHGVAWDQITDDEVFYGESNNSDFIKKFVKNPNFIIIWYPLLQKIFKTVRNYTKYIHPTDICITCGKEFVSYDTSKKTWSLRLRADSVGNLMNNPDIGRCENVDAYNKRKEDFENNRNAAKFAVGNAKTYSSSIKNGIGPIQGHLTVDLLATNTYCACIAISKETIAKYSTVNLMQQRYDSKFNSVADLRTNVSAEDRYKVLHNNPNMYISSWNKPKDFKDIGVVDYPQVRAANKQRYKLTIGKAKGIKLLSKYADAMKEYRSVMDEIQDVIDNAGKTKVTPDAIKSMADDKFVDIFFNYKAPQNINTLSYELKCMEDYFAGIINKINEICTYYNGSRDSQYSKYNDGNLRKEKDVKDLISQLDSFYENSKKSFKRLCDEYQKYRNSL